MSKQIVSKALIAVVVAFISCTAIAQTSTTKSVQPKASSARNTAGTQSSKSTSAKKKRHKRTIAKSSLKKRKGSATAKVAVAPVPTDAQAANPSIDVPLDVAPQTLSQEGDKEAGADVKTKEEVKKKDAEDKKEKDAKKKGDKAGGDEAAAVQPESESSKPREMTNTKDQAAMENSNNSMLNLEANRHKATPSAAPIMVNGEQKENAQPATTPPGNTTASPAQAPKKVLHKKKHS